MRAYGIQDYSCERRCTIVCVIWYSRERRCDLFQDYSCERQLHNRLCYLVQLREAAVRSCVFWYSCERQLRNSFSSIIRQGRRSRPLFHKYLLAFHIFHTSQLREVQLRYEHHQAASTEPC